MSGRARSPAPFLAAVLIAIPLLITAGLCTDFEVQPEAITPRSPFSIALHNVTDGTGLNITVTPMFLAPATTSWCNFTNWWYSFGLKKGNVTVHGENTNRILLLVRTGRTYQMTEDTGTGDIVVSFPLEFLPEAYYDFRILYEVHDAKVPVRLSLMQQGTKVGPEDSVSTPNVYGINEGNLTVQVREGGQLLGSSVVRIGPATTITTTTTTTVPTTPAPTAVSTGTPTTPIPTTPAPATTVTTQPATTRVPTRSPVTTPVTTPAATPAPEPASEGVSPVILVYAAVIIIIAIFADYFLLKD